MSLVSLPFYFRQYAGSENYLITNMGGAHQLVDRSSLQQLADGSYSQLTAPLREKLLATNFLSETRELQTRVNILASRYATKLLQRLTTPSLFMIVPTLRCDHDCGYCQVSRAPINKPGVDQELSNIQKIIEIIRATDSTNIKIEFQGGEPLLAFAYIKAFVTQAKIQLTSQNPTFVICTALATISKEILEWARDNPVTFSVSLDGPEELHNRNRPSRHFNAYQQVVRNIQKIQSTLSPDRISCVATATRESLKYPRDIVREYVKLSLERVFIRPLSPFGFAYHAYKKLGYSAEEYAAFYKDTLDEVLKLNTDHEFVDDMTLIYLKNIYQSGTSGYVDMQSPSGYLLAAMIFNYDGRIFGSDEARMLWETTKNSDLVLGTIDDDISTLVLHKPSAQLLQDSFLSCMPGCEECVYQPYCGADPLFHLATQGDHIGDKSISFFCQSQRKIMDYLFQLIYSEPSTQLVFEQWLKH